MFLIFIIWKINDSLKKSKTKAIRKTGLFDNTDSAAIIRRVHNAIQN